MSKHVVTHVCVERSEGDCEAVHVISLEGLCAWKEVCVSHVLGAAGGNVWHWGTSSPV